ncbi:hypothetical protein D6783_01850 [Candidatus Woesearchaeota archaeon]|nr:MAG: hypothetical protein D6783_01850 [Candidatus Woesearchaeota archaeon]
MVDQTKKSELDGFERKVMVTMFKKSLWVSPRNPRIRTVFPRTWIDVGIDSLGDSRSWRIQDRENVGIEV